MPDTHTPPLPRLTWDIFCHVIDNWGDLGVCWRLSADLASRGQTVRLWVDDPSPLAWMAPGALAGAWAGVEVRTWPRTTAAPPPRLPPGDVLIEAFGCEIAPAWVQALLPDRPGAQGVWLNLEYLSAESYVERCHRLPSPVLSGPLSGRLKWFFYPGFTPSTGGLLRESDLMQRRDNFASTHQPPPTGPTPPSGDGPTVSLFCYEPAALPGLLRHPDLAHAHWRVAPGRALAAFDAARSALPATAQWTALPHCPQSAFDHTLWACDLNFVRGEDSLVRALWAGQAFVWQIYPQDDHAHHAKLEAFLDWLQAPPDLRQMHHHWNGIGHASAPRLGHATLARWRAAVCQARERLLQQADLSSQLLGFVTEKR
ncbi:elongation factor P maturation arginine rhamnosyltransferase EarP [Macromonas nakdongensis]|uniref:elongation factor P maturation arginine rhamnosyltransferase EarP n=1 Tax=Macromonas nakdongensis TaxID=1843082 RepID=UPI000C345D46|nr:elongation factor P maturation arginine rhamnosyltransferase EarP [Macromonas nakdongensis]